jgi:hypothetical protein
MNNFDVWIRITYAKVFEVETRISNNGDRYILGRLKNGGKPDFFVKRVSETGFDPILSGDFRLSEDLCKLKP